MNVRKKAILAVAGILLISLIVILFMSQTIILSNFESLEKKDTQTQIGRADDALNRRILDLDTFTNSYGAWDDTYEFIADNNTAYLESNANDQTLQAANVNFMTFVNASGQIVFSSIYGLTGTNESLMNAGLSNLLITTKGLWNFSGTQDGTKGLVNIAGKLFLVASRPIITSQFTGPVRGAVLMGEQVDDGFVGTLMAQTHLDMMIVCLTNNNIPLSFQQAQTKLNNANSIYVEPANSTIVSGFTLLTDVNGNSIALLNVNLERSIYAVGINTVNTFTVLIVVSFIVFGSFTVIFLEKALLSRISKLNELVSKITKSNDINQRVNLDVKQFRSSNDELNLLSKSINQMLDKIQEITGSLNKSYRFAAIGELSVMIAHDLRNPLQGITVATDFLKREKASSPESKERMLELIKKDVNYCEKIVNDLLGYSKEIRIDPSRTDLNNLLNTSLSHITIPENVQINNLIQTEPKIDVDIEKMERVFDNLTKNAIDAMPEGGSLTVKSEILTDKMQISFADTGKGISKEDMKKMFVPLFTTKAKGMGFGLAICKRIIEAHEGTISVQSIVGKGTTFTLEIPLRKT